MTLVCRNCGQPEDLLPFVLALDGRGRRMRGYFHLHCYMKVQREITEATRKWVLVSTTDDVTLGITGTPRAAAGKSFAEAWNSMRPVHRGS